MSVEKPWQVFVSQVFQGEVPAIRIRSQGFVLDVRYEKEFASELTESVLEQFREHGIEAPAEFHRASRGRRAKRSPRTAPETGADARPRRSRLRVRQGRRSD